MYAIIEFKGKQFRAEQGKNLSVPYLEDLQPGQALDIDRVLLVGEGADVSIGQPVISGAAVKAEVLSHGRLPKIIIFKKKRRKTYQKKQGHRQDFTVIRINDITK